MCRPDFFDIEYSINPWMDIANQPDVERTKAEWEALHADYLQAGFEIVLIEPVKGLPDMVFTANGALVIDSKVMLPRFKYPQRQGETTYFQQWFEQNGYSEIKMPKHDFEGEGDALLVADLILAGHGFRSSVDSHAELSTYFDREVISLKLINPQFYHLDTALSVLDEHTIMFYPQAFDEASQEQIRMHIPNVIEAGDADALAFGLNAVSDGYNVILSDRASGLHRQLKEQGFNPVLVDISEFQKSGGGVKCLTLELR